MAKSLPSPVEFCSCHLGFAGFTHDNNPVSQDLAISVAVRYFASFSSYGHLRQWVQMSKAFF